MSEPRQTERWTHPWIERAFQDTLTGVLSTKNFILYAVTVVILAGYGRTQQVSDAIYWGFALVLATLGWLILGLVINGVAAPYRIEREGRLAAEAVLTNFTVPARVQLVSPPVSTDGYHTTTFSGFQSVSGRSTPPREVNSPDRWRFHIAESGDGIHIECQKWFMEVPETVECWVESPNGDRYQGQLRRAADSTVRCTYPTDFGMEPVPGPHHVHWLHKVVMGDPAKILQTKMHDPLDFTIAIQSKAR